MKPPPLPYLFIAGALVVAGLGAGTYAITRPAASLDAAGLMAGGRYREAQAALRSKLASRPSDAALHVSMAEVQSRLADPIASEKEYRRAIALGASPAAVIPELGEQVLLQGRYADVLSLVPARGATAPLAARNLFLRSVAQLSLNDMPAAEASFAMARKVAPGEIGTLLIAARISAAKRDVAGTEAAITAVLQCEPNQVDALLMQEQLLTAKGDRAGAMAAIDRAIAAAPWSAMARIDRATLLMFNGDDAAAQRDVLAVLQSQPRFIDALYLDGILMARRGKFAEAALQLSRLDGIGPRFPQVMYYQALVAQKQGNRETAADLARRYNQLMPGDLDGLRLRAETALAIGRGEAVLPLVQTAVAANPDVLALQVTLGRLLTAAGQTPDGGRVLLAVAAQSPTDLPTMGELGLALLGAGQPQQALPLLETAAKAQPALEDLWRGYARAAIEVNRPGIADQSLDGLRAASGGTAETGNLQGLLLLQKGDPEGARESWAATLARFPDAIPPRMNLARLAFQRGDRDLALRFLGEILGRDPTNMPALQSFLALVGDNEALAEPRIEAAAQAQPQSPLFLSLMADTRTRRGHPEEAIGLIKRAFATGRVPSLLLPALGRAQSAAGEPEDAVASYKAALAASPGDSVVRGALLSIVRRRDGAAAAAAILEDGLKSVPGDVAQMTALVQLTDEATGLAAASALADRLRLDVAHLPYSAVLKGDLLMRHGEVKRAALAYAEDFTRAPSLVLLLRLAAAEARDGHSDTAEERLRAWYGRNPSSLDAGAMLAKLDMAAGRVREAAATLEGIVKADAGTSDRIGRPEPGVSRWLNDLAWCYDQLGDGRARALAQAAYLAAPTAEAADTLGWILFRGGSAVAALPLLKAAVAQQPGDPTLRYHLAAVLAASGDRAGAVTQLVALDDTQSPIFPDKGNAAALLTRLR